MTDASAAAEPEVQIRSLSFLSPGNFPDDHPEEGLEDTLGLFELGEQLSFDGAWIRQRHLEHGVSSAAVFLAAASQRTRRIELGTAVIPIGYESPFRLGEDLSTADVLSRGRLQVGMSAGTPPHAELMAGLVFDGDWRTYDFSHRRIARLIDGLRGDYIGGPDTVIRSPGNVQRPRLQPHAEGLTDRLWYGAASRSSVHWAAEAGLNLLTGNIVLFAPDLVGPSEQIVERLRADAAVQRVSELRIELPYEFGRDDYVQILHDVAHRVAPQLGWRPAVAETPAA